MTQKVTISLPDELHAYLERLSSQTGASRSQVIHESLRLRAELERRRDLAQRDREGYTRFPETPEEVAESHAAALALFAEEETWD